MSTCIYIYVMTVHHRGNQSSVPPTLDWEFIGTGACEWVRDDESFNWVDVHGQGALLTNISSEGSVSVSMPWQGTGAGFPFFGGLKHDVRIFADGYVSFAGGEHMTGRPQALPSPESPNDLIAPFWSSFNVAQNGGVYTYAPPSGDYFAVEWYNVPLTGQDRPCDFEAILFRNGSMSFMYKQMYQPPAFAAPSIGLENSAGSDGIRIAYGMFDDEHRSNMDFWNAVQNRSTVRIPSACYTEVCGPQHWVTAVYSDLTMAHSIQQSCHEWAASAAEVPDGFLTIPSFRSPGAWCPLPKSPGSTTCPSFSALFITHVQVGTAFPDPTA